MALPFTINVSGTGYSPLSMTTSGNVTENINQVIPANTANVSVPSLVFNYANLQSVLLYCTDGNLTVKTNSPSAPNQTLSFVGNIPLNWVTGMPSSNPFTANLTAGLYVTNASAANVTLVGTFNFN